LRSLSDYLTKELTALGLPSIRSHELFEGKQVITFANGARVSVGAFASDTEIQAAVRKAFHMSDPETSPTPPEGPAATAATKLPVVEMKPSETAPPVRGRPIPAAGDYKAGSLKELLGGLRNRKQDVMGEAVKEAKRAHKALDMVAQTSADMRATTEGILDEMREFTNEIPDLDGE
jgi:hypothetical protein